MKRFIATLAAAAVAMMGVSAFAQASVGVGYLSSPLKTKVNSTSASTNLNGFYVGADYNIPLISGIGMAPGLYFSYLGHEDSGVKTNETYLTVPVMFNYGFEVSPAVRLSAYAGPSFALGLSSNTKYESVKSNNYDGDGYKQFDVLLGLGLAADINDILRVSLGYDWGAIDRNGDAVGTLHRNQLHVGVAYLF